MFSKFLEHVVSLFLIYSKYKDRTGQEPRTLGPGFLLIVCDLGPTLCVGLHQHTERRRNVEPACSEVEYVVASRQSRRSAAV